ncbi:MAG: sigma-54-dependent Fis family transcriptional regulator [Deltaproteobacteria bacterium]|nr:sigma-54-dependent Fis family transcriptional regulator [Nannocystaceae bacterium]
MNARVLIVDDDENTCELLEATLGGQGFSVFSESSAEAALSRLTEEDFDAMLTDIHMDGIDGIELCGRVRAIRPDLPVMVVTGQASMDAAVAALRAGAYDFITKPIDVELLGPAITRAVQRHRLGIEVKRLRRALADAQRFGAIIGKSTPMRRVFDMVSRVADSEASVMVTGESGTGKELIARSIHERSPRASGPFVALNCAAVPPSLIESELFGHVKGAFTDARNARDGLFAQAGGGTLFLDEIGEMPLEMQPKLLRALQERTIRPVGGDKEVPFDARLVTATNRDLESEVEAGRFREDLLYRIDVVRVELPPLRMRGRDVLLLAQSFVEHFAAQSGRAVGQIDPAAAELLLNYDWPGNVRELENCMERAVALSRLDRVTVDDLPSKVREHKPERVVLTGEESDELPTLEELERRYIAKVLRAMAGNKSQAAKTLGLDRRTLYRRLDKHGLGA